MGSVVAPCDGSVVAPCDGSMGSGGFTGSVHVDVDFLKGCVLELSCF